VYEVDEFDPARAPQTVVDEDRIVGCVPEEVFRLAHVGCRVDLDLLVKLVELFLEDELMVGVVFDDADLHALLFFPFTLPHSPAE